MSTTVTNTNRTRTSVRFVSSVIIALILLLMVEFFAFIVLRHIIIPKNSSLVYVPPKIDRTLYSDYLEFRHPVLGWATLAPEGYFSAVLESRPNPSFPDSNESCVSIYGDSFTHGSEVTDTEAWGNVLSGLLGCKVANFGLPGYGMDQAYLRFTLNDRDQAPISILGVYPYNILRNLNQYRPFIAGPNASVIGLKPRFVIEDNDLHLIPPPDLNYEELLEGIKSPADFFPHETFIPGSVYGAPVLSFPNTLVLFRFVKSQAMLNFILKQPSWIDFLDEDHPTDAITIADKIMQNFASVAQERGHRSMIVIFPTVSSFRYYKRTGSLATQPLSDLLGRNGIAHIDLHKDISDYLGERHYCEMQTDVKGCSGHFNAEANRVIATLLKQYMDVAQGSPSTRL